MRALRVKSGKILRKPVLLIETNDIQDEALQFLIFLATEISLFKELNLDVLLHRVNASGLTAFNLMQKYIAPVSHDIAGVLLRHDFFANNLDLSENISDCKQEKKKFSKAA